jgi:16S rRNA processing protein RimM
MATVGRIARAHGSRGQVIVNPDSDFLEERFRTGAELYIERDGEVQSITVTTVRFQQNRPVIGIEGVHTMNDAETFAGHELRVPVDRLAPLPSGTFYQHDLIGCRVETTRGEFVGVVKGIEGTLGSSRLAVTTARGEVLVPLVSEICTTVEPAAKRIVIDPPNGLLDLAG